MNDNNNNDYDDDRTNHNRNKRRLLQLSSYHRTMLYCIEHHSISIFICHTNHHHSGTNTEGRSMNSSSNNYHTVITQLPIVLYERNWTNDMNDNNSNDNDFNNNQPPPPTYQQYHHHHNTTSRSSSKRSIVITQSKSRNVIVCANMAQQFQNDNMKYHDDPMITYHTTTTTNTTTQYNHHHNIAPIRYVTHDILLHEICTIDPLLQHYSIILFGLDDDNENIIDTDNNTRINTLSMTTELVLSMIQKIRYHRTLHLILVCTVSRNASKYLQYFINNDIIVNQIIQDSSSRAMTKSSTLISNSYTQPQSSTSASVSLLQNNLPLWNQTGTILSIGSSHHHHTDQVSTSPIDIIYLLEPTKNYITTLIETIYQIHIKYPKKLQQQHHHSSSSSTSNYGDILCFAPTSYWIDYTVQLSQEYFDQQQSSSSSTYDVDFVPCHYIDIINDMDHDDHLTFHSKQQQQQVQMIFQTSNQYNKRKRRIIFAMTNKYIPTISTSMTKHHHHHNNNTTIHSTATMTIPNIQFVIDCGYIQLSYLDIQSHIERSSIVPISQECAKYRSMACTKQHNHTNITSSSSSIQQQQYTNNVCIRLYPELYYTDQMSETTIRPIHRDTNTIIYYILLLKSIGVDNILTFEFISQQQPHIYIEQIQYALEVLYIMGAIDDTTHITNIGYDMLSIPYMMMDIYILRMIIASIQYNCSYEILTIASILHVMHQYRHHHPTLFISKPRQVQQQIIDYEEIVSNIVDYTGDHISYYNIFATIIDQNHYHTDHMIHDICQENFLHFHIIKQCIEYRKQLIRLIRTKQFFGSNTNTKEQQQQQRMTIISSSSTQNSFLDDTVKESIRLCITAGYILHIGKLQNHDGQYYTMHNQHIPIQLSKSSLYTQYNKMSSEYIVYYNVAAAIPGNAQRPTIGLISQQQSNNNNDVITVQHISTIEGKWLREIAPHYFE